MEPRSPTLSLNSSTKERFQNNIPQNIIICIWYELSIWLKQHDWNDPRRGRSTHLRVCPLTYTALARGLFASLRFGVCAHTECVYFSLGWAPYILIVILEYSHTSVCSSRTVNKPPGNEIGNGYETSGQHRRHTFEYIRKSKNILFIKTTITLGTIIFINYVD